MKEFIEKLIGRLEEEVEYQGKKADESDVFEEVSVSHTRISMRKCYEHAIEIINELAEKYNNGWIPCSERLPETNESVLCWAKSTARGGDVCFVGSCHNGFWFLQSSADTHSFPGQYVIVAWQPIQPYKEEGV